MSIRPGAVVLTLRDGVEWRAWLAENHETATGAWVLRARAGSTRELVSYSDAIRQALCFGWVDGTVSPFDDETVGMWFAPRKAASSWAATNKQRVRELEESGEMTDAGRRVIERAKQNGMWEVLDGPEAGIEPPELRAALDADPTARANWDAFPPSSRKVGLTAIAMARKPETRTARILRIVTDAAAGVRP